MNMLSRAREGLGSLLSPRDVAEATPEITNAVTNALQEVISRSDGGPVVVINNLTVSVQIIAAQGGDATINVKS